MTDLDLASLAPELARLMDESSRINPNLPERYWYPLSVATYGVEEVLEALESMVAYRTTMWEKTRTFEKLFGEKFGGEAVMVNSGSSADLLIAFALHERSGGPLRAGDEVLIPAVTWPTQLWSALMCGYSAVLVDVDPATMNVDFSDLESKITPRTRAISLVHLMGNPVDMDRIRDLCERHDLLLIEDCCESLGAMWNGQYVGTFGVASAFSFFFSHHITTMEGGMILTQDRDFAERLRLLRAHGWSRNLVTPPDTTEGIDPRYTFLNWGFNVRPTELQAGFGIVQLGRVDAFQVARNRNAAAAQRRLESHREWVSLMEVPAGADCSWFALPLLISEDSPISRDQLAAFLEERGVETRPVVTGNLARHPATNRFADVLATGSLPGADAVHERGLYIGIHPIESEVAMNRLFDLFDELASGVAQRA